MHVFWSYFSHCSFPFSLARSRAPKFPLPLPILTPATQAMIYTPPYPRANCFKTNPSQRQIHTYKTHIWQCPPRDRMATASQVFQTMAINFKIKFKYSTFFVRLPFLEHTKIARESHFARGNASQEKKKLTNITLLHPF